MIPLQVPFKIRPDINDPIRQSVIYTFTENDIVEKSKEYILYKIPHSPCTYWTNFRFPSSEKIDLIVITSEGASDLITTQTRPNEWHDTFWPLPSIDVTDQTGYYFKIRCEPGDLHIPITLVGFIELFQSVSSYQLLSPDTACQYIIIKEDPTSYDKHKKERGVIRKATLEQKGEGEIIRPISQYF